MSTALIFVVVTIALSAIVFLILRKSGKAEKIEEPLGYEAASIPVLVAEEIKKGKATKAKPKTKVSKNTAKNKSLAKMEAKPRKATKTTRAKK